MLSRLTILDYIKVLILYTGQRHRYKKSGFTYRGTSKGLGIEISKEDYDLSQSARPDTNRNF